MHPRNCRLVHLAGFGRHGRCHQEQAVVKEILNQTAVPVQQMEIPLLEAGALPAVEALTPGGQAE